MHIYTQSCYSSIYIISRESYYKNLKTPIKYSNFINSQFLVEYNIINL